MAKINLVIVDYDERYIKGVSTYFNNNYGDKFYITGFSNKEYAMDYLKSGKRIDIVLINKDLYFDEIKKYNIKSKVILGEAKEAGVFENYPLINKYTPGSMLYEIIIKAYAEQSPENLERVVSNHTSTKILTVYSPIGGIGKTTLAVSLCKELASRGLDVLYLNLEDVQSTELYFNCEEETGLSDFIFAIKERNNNIRKKFVDFSLKDESSSIRYFSPTESILDIEDLDKDDIKFMLESLLDLKMFNYIIVDTSSKFNSQYKMILNSSNHIVFPIGKDSSSTIKTNIFLNNINNMDNYYILINKARTDVEYTIPSVIEREHKAIEQAIPYDIKLSITGEQGIEENINITRAIQDIILKLRLV
ncbi:AAA domain-containing protein [Clostridium cavendishii DSM 21758]|uniref:AAA domain-containing protein n=1 Tax=Clostridium cavendishii DSM 21758 TaxID=1121302 RepID=A0A1M6QHP2_9CLOT|nr:AAA family ATPase [Clostridium cavendishii]SHK19751.1 AAA domain-containing protein [Clostridium cavendishii DSM 21758]